MDLYGALRELYDEKKRLDFAIMALESRLVTRHSPALKRRGRKSMNETERLEVSRRMRAYWESKKGIGAAGQTVHQTAQAS